MMRFLIITVFLISVTGLGLSINLFGAGVPVKSAKHLSTDVSFEDLVISGQYQYPDEATATVEDEKVMDDLIGVRKEFKDRLKQSTKRR